MPLADGSKFGGTFISVKPFAPEKTASIPGAEVSYGRPPAELVNNEELGGRPYAAAKEAAVAASIDSTPPKGDEKVGELSEVIDEEDLGKLIFTTSVLASAAVNPGGPLISGFVSPPEEDTAGFGGGRLGPVAPCLVETRLEDEEPAGNWAREANMRSVEGP